MPSLNKQNSTNSESSNTSVHQTSAESLEAMRPSESIPPRIITHSYDPKPSNTFRPGSNDYLQHKDD